MARPTQTPETESRRARAYALYAASELSGIRRSLRSIAQELGVALKTVQNWRDVDRWSDKLSVQLDERARAVGDVTRGIENLMRTSLSEHINTLNTIIRSGKTDADRIRGIREFVEIYRKLGIPLPNADDVTVNDKPAEFEDDVPAPAEKKPGSSADPEEKDLT